LGAVQLSQALLRQQQQQQLGDALHENYCLAEKHVPQQWICLLLLSSSSFGSKLVHSRVTAKVLQALRSV
jgi:hypothetical protein